MHISISKIQDEAQRENSVPDRNCMDVFPFLLHAVGRATVKGEDPKITDI